MPIPNDSIRRAAVETASAIISGEVSLIEGCVRLFSLSCGLVSDWRTDPDFRVFGVVASDTDHLPTGSARSYWNVVALEREDVNIAQYEAQARAEVVLACQNIVARFAGA